jgi:hypothetical protein
LQTQALSDQNWQEAAASGVALIALFEMRRDRRFAEAFPRTGRQGITITMAGGAVIGPLSRGRKTDATRSFCHGK